MPELSTLLSFMLAATLVIIIPGPATLLVAGQAKQSGRRAAVAVAGIVAGDMVLITLSAAGFAVLMQSLPWLLPVMRLLGAAYLLYLGVTLLRSHAAQTQQDAQAHARARQSWTCATRGGPLPSTPCPRKHRAP